MSGTRLFFVVCLLLAAALLVAVTTSTLRPRAMSPEAAAGMHLWQAHNCEGCHTLYGQGGPYAPDLTHIYDQRGEGYLREFLANPAAFHPNQRIMPTFGLTVSETDHLLAFLQWVGDQDVAANWPPRVIQVSGGGNLDTGLNASSETAALPDDRAGRGAILFKSAPANCSTCHAILPDVIVVGPSLAGVATRAETRVPSVSAEAYIRDSIVNPGDFIVPGFQDVMQKNLGAVLNSDQISDLIAFLMTLK